MKEFDIEDFYIKEDSELQQLCLPINYSKLISFIKEEYPNKDNDFYMNIIMRIGRGCFNLNLVMEELIKKNGTERS